MPITPATMRVRTAPQMGNFDETGIRGRIAPPGGDAAGPGIGSRQRGRLLSRLAAAGAKGATRGRTAGKMRPRGTTWRES